MSIDKSIFFAGVRFDHITLNDLKMEILDSQSKMFKLVVTPNVDHVIRCNRDDNFKSLYSKADISVNDSRVLNKLGSLFGFDFGHVVPGSDLTKSLLENLPDRNTSITVIGCSESTVMAVCNKYKLTNVSHYNPPMGFINNDIEVNKCLAFINKNPSKLVFICVGCPRQEQLSLQAKAAGAKGFFLCVGASWLFLSGEEKRAPEWLQKLSCEWLYRLLQSPKRLFKRYLIDGPQIIPIFIKEKLKK